ncbi:MAG: hypothetical protein OXF66_06020 [Gammaproteobacteria bacterium]|nr:hypothetical protein [Gammaproteobacteria bacterium]
MTGLAQRPLLRPAVARVRLSGLICDDLVNRCVEEADALIEEYFYERVEFLIDSPGGSAASVFYLLEAFVRWQEAGVRIDTRALTNAESAGALALSLGDTRRAAMTSRLLYHSARVAPQGNSFLTASNMRSEGRRLGELDRTMLRRLAERACRIDRESWMEHLLNQPAGLEEAGFNKRLICERLFQAPPASAGPDEMAAEALAGRQAGETEAGQRAQAAPEAAETPAGAVSAGFRGDPDATLNKRMADVLMSEADGDSARARFFSIYKNLFALDVPVSAATAKSLGLIDAVGADDPNPLRALRHAREPAQKPGLPDSSRLDIPEWGAIRPGGAPVETLARHTLILGETGSGKTVSGVLPIVRAALRRMGRDCAGRAVGCLLIIDPKRDIAPALDGAVGADIRRLAISGGQEGERVRLDLMAGTPIDLSVPDLRQAARGILGKAASIDPNNPMKTLSAEGAATGNDRFWTQQGTELGLVFLEMALILLNLFGDYKEAAKWHERIDGRLRKFIEHRDAGKNVLFLANHLLSGFSGLRSSDNLPLLGSLARSLAAPEQLDNRRAVSQIKAWRARTERLESYMQEERLYTSIVASSDGCFMEYCAPDAAESLYFGCEPIIARQPSECLDLGALVSPDIPRPQVLLIQPDIQRAEGALLARAFKAAFFQAVLRDPARSAPDAAGIPLVGYVADEFHRFITADLRHGEQSFLDTCRSFGAFCVLSCQSVSSLEHALREIGAGVSTESSIRVLLANTGTKLFFRSTDQETQRLLRDVVPTGQWGSPLEARPVTTLRTGECYAVLTGGQIARRQLGWVDLRK